MEKNMANFEKIKQQFLQQPGVQAVGIGYKIKDGVKTAKPAVIVSVKEKKDVSLLAPDEVIPKTVTFKKSGADPSTAKTDVIETGTIKAFSHTDKLRPVPGGVSVGHTDVSAGTLGCWVEKDGWPHFISNNHVLANSNAAQIGDAILQPGVHDGGTSNDRIAQLVDFVPINFVGDPSDCKVAAGINWLFNAACKAINSRTRHQAVRVKGVTNVVDAAIARVNMLDNVDHNILGIGKYNQYATPVLNMPVIKSGRTTGVTTGIIEQVEVSVNVQYGAGKVAIFTDQVMAGGMSAPGDSGSAILNENTKDLVGLLFAGSDTTTIINPIKFVIDALDFNLY